MQWVKLVSKKDENWANNIQIGCEWKFKENNSRVPRNVSIETNKYLKSSLKFKVAERKMLNKIYSIKRKIGIKLN